MIRKFKNYTKEELLESGMTFGKDVYIADDVIIHNPQNIVIGDNVRIDTQCVLIAGKNYKITIGSNVHISAGCYFYGNSGNIIIGDCCCTSNRCTLYTANDDYTEGYMANSVIDEKYKKVKTGDIELKNHALVGCYTVILPNVVLEYATSVGAHSLINKSTNPFDVVAGAPAKYIKKRKNVNLLTVGFLTLSDINNHEATEKSIDSFKKYHDGKVVVVNTQHTDEINRLEKDGVTVINPPIKLPYPLFSITEIDRLVDYIVEGILKPSLELDTDYFVFGEPDCMFFNKTGMEHMDPNIDIFTPTPCGINEELFWVFMHFFIGYGNDDESRLARLNKLFDQFGPICKKYGLDWKAAADSDLRFIFTCGSIIKTKRIQDLYIHHRDDIRGLMKDLCLAIYNNRPIPEINPSHTSLFSFDIQMSILLGLYLFKWKINPSYKNSNQGSFPNEESLHTFLKLSPETEFIHSIKLHYSEKNELVCSNNINEKLGSVFLT